MLHGFSHSISTPTQVGITTVISRHHSPAQPRWQQSLQCCALLQSLQHNESCEAWKCFSPAQWSRGRTGPCVPRAAMGREYRRKHFRGLLCDLGLSDCFLNLFPSHLQMEQSTLTRGPLSWPLCIPGLPGSSVDKLRGFSAETPATAERGLSTKGRSGSKQAHM
jgi:hypothetical protein